MPLVKVLEFALVGGIAENIVAKHGVRVKERYDKAREVAANVNFDVNDIGLAEAA